jgi:RimJ/RimL family protein N-acetyltransferase
MRLMMERVFDLGYRRYEWKCNALNTPSCAAARRLGFVFEGVFRQACVVKGRNRDSAWFSVLDREWPRLRDRFSSWLAPTNFDANGRQKMPLSEC